MIHLQWRWSLIVTGVVVALTFGCTSSSPGDQDIAAAPPTPPRSIVIDWLDFIYIGGIEYLTIQIEKEPPLQEEDLGAEFGRVAFKYEGNVFDPYYRPKYGKDGDAAFLEVGTPVYSVKGYKPEFILAARRNNKLVLYGSDTTPNAEVGSDVLDLEGKVKYIALTSPRDRNTELASIRDQPLIETLVGMVLDAPVDLEAQYDRDSDVYFLVFHLNDGITVTRAYRPEYDLLGGVLQLPREFRTAISDPLR